MTTTPPSVPPDPPSFELRPYGPLIAFWNDKTNSPRRSLQVLDLLLAGYSYKECAVELTIGETSVHGHIDRMTAKLGAKLHELKAMRLLDYSHAINDLRSTVATLVERVDHLEQRVQHVEIENDVLHKIIVERGQGSN